MTIVPDFGLMDLIPIFTHDKTHYAAHADHSPAIAPGHRYAARSSVCGIAAGHPPRRIERWATAALQPSAGWGSEPLKGDCRASLRPVGGEVSAAPRRPGHICIIRIANRAPPATCTAMPRPKLRGQQIVHHLAAAAIRRTSGLAAGSPDLRAFPWPCGSQLIAQRLRLQGESLLRYGDPQAICCAKPLPPTSTVNARREVCVMRARLSC